jgi:hypothetical protein
MANTGKDLIVVKWNPRILLRNLKDALSHFIGTSGPQLTHNTVPFSNVKTAKKTIGVLGKTGCDFNFTAPANTTAQNIQLTGIVPANARVLEVRIRNTESPLGLVSMALTAGNASAGAQFLASVQCFTLAAIAGTLLALLWTVAPVATASDVWIGATPGANWSLDTTNVGKWEVNVTYIEVS